MRTSRPTTMLLSLGLCLATAPRFFAAEESADAVAQNGDHAARPVHAEAPVYPPALFNTGIRGEANVICGLDLQGRVTEVVLVDATRTEFGRAAVEAARLWTFEPAVRDGQAVRSRVLIPFVFNDGVSGQVETVMRRKVYFDLKDPVVQAESLSAWPRPVTRAFPRYPQSLKGTGTSGVVMVSFVIDHDGQVVNPAVVKSAHPDFVVPALVTAATFKFDPVHDPMGDPVNVSMVVEFSFDERMLKEQEMEKMKRIVVRRPSREEEPPQEKPSR